MTELDLYTLRARSPYHISVRIPMQAFGGHDQWSVCLAQRRGRVRCSGAAEALRVYRDMRDRWVERQIKLGQNIGRPSP